MRRKRFAFVAALGGALVAGTLLIRRWPHFGERLFQLWQNFMTELADRAEPNITWIADDLAVGGRIMPDEWSRVAQAGVRAVLDCRAEARDPEDILEGLGMTFLHLPTRDSGDFTPLQVVEGVEWVERQLAEGRPTLVHCQAGKGRSVMMTAAVLSRRGMEPDDAVDLIRRLRPIITPTPGQLARLRAFVEGAQPLLPDLLPGQFRA